MAAGWVKPKRGANGDPIEYNHNGFGHYSGWTQHPDRRIDTYHLPIKLPAGPQLVAWLLTAKAVAKEPFHIENLPISALWAAGRPVGEAAIMLSGLVRELASNQDFEKRARSHHNEAVGLEVEMQIRAAWADVPSYVSLLDAESNVTQQPKLIASVPPEQVVGVIHPHLRVVVSFLVDANGNVEAARVLEPGNPAFDKVAVEAVLRWKFIPGRNASGPIPVFTVVPFEFAASGPS